MPSLDTLQARLGVRFADAQLLRSALVHRSFLHEHPDQGIGLLDGERLEFLGDAILNYLAATLLFERYPERGEGQLTGMRSALVKTTTLAAFARDLGLGAYVRLSKGEEQSGARDRDALLADTFEALVAAIYLDQGLETARTFVCLLFEQQLARIESHGLALDYKSQLQQRIQAERNITPRYKVVAEQGQDPRREYTIEVLAGNIRLGTGHGHSKQAAAQAAAQVALEQLDNFGF
ncbi:MAG TPA: ribonuclease III [Roseiflexaceae bacterium]